MCDFVCQQTLCIMMFINEFSRLSFCGRELMCAPGREKKGNFSSYFGINFTICKACVCVCVCVCVRWSLVIME